MILKWDNSSISFLCLNLKCSYSAARNVISICCDWLLTAVGLLSLVVHSLGPPVIGQFLKFLTCESDRVSGYSSISVGGISAVLQPCRPNLSSTDWWYSSLCDNNTCLSLLNCQHKPQLCDQWLELQSYSSATRLQSDTGQSGICTGIGVLLWVEYLQ